MSADVTTTALGSPITVATVSAPTVTSSGRDAVNIRAMMRQILIVAWLTRPEHVKRLATEEQYEWLRELGRKLFTKENQNEPS